MFLTYLQILKDNGNRALISLLKYFSNGFLPFSYLQTPQVSIQNYPVLFLNPKHLSKSNLTMRNHIIRYLGNVQSSERNYIPLRMCNLVKLSESN